MASRELYSSIAKPKKKYTFGQKLGDVGKLSADTMLSTLGASDVISDDAYKGEWAKKTSGILSPIAGVAGQVALAAATGGTGNAALSAAKAVGPEIFAKGGLRTFKGNTHEQGGIQLGQDEVEGGETMMPMDAQSDFIFSDRLSPIKSISPKGKIIYSKKTFAQKSKEINKPLEIRPNDPYAKKTADIKLKKLAQEQEILKSTTIKSPANHMAMGGMKYDGGGVKTSVSPIVHQSKTGNNLYGGVGESDVATLKSNNPWYNWEGFDYSNPKDVLQFQQTFNRNAGQDLLTADSLLGTQTATAILRNDIGQTKLTPKGYNNTPGLKLATSEQHSSMLDEMFKKVPDASQQPYKSNFLIPALGYTAQALTNIPGLLAKPETINSSRVKFKDINLAEQRNEARRSRNLGLATARGIGSTDAGQMMNYLSGTTAGLNSVYGNQFNQSLLQEEQANVETNMREQLANSEIERYDAQINAQEKDAARALRMNALQNLGTIAAGAGKDYMAMQESDNMINILRGSNPDFTYDIRDGKLVPIRNRVGEKKRRRTV